MELSDHTKSQMQKVIDLIAETPQKFDMTGFCRREKDQMTTLPSEGTCGTVGCIAGYAQALLLHHEYKLGREGGQTVFLRPTSITQDHADSYLALTHRQGEQLYFMDGLGGKTRTLWERYEDHPLFNVDSRNRSEWWYEINIGVYGNVTAEHAITMLKGLIDGTFEF